MYKDKFISHWSTALSSPWHGISIGCRKFGDTTFYVQQQLVKILIGANFLCDLYRVHLWNQTCYRTQCDI